MRNSIYISLMITFIFCNSYTDNYNSNLYNSQTILTYNDNYLSRDLLKSAVIPGWGQYSTGNYYKATAFFCIEAIALGVYYNYHIKAIKEGDLTDQFADKHWSFEKWITDYYIVFENSEFRDIFTNGEDVYTDLWDGGHTIKFFYENEYHTTGGNNFEEFYHNTLCQGGDGACADSLFFTLIDITKDHHYYENIGKYDHFFAGWDDATIDETYVFIKESGEKIAMSPNKRKYRDNWELEADFNRIADYALYTIYANHIMSFLDRLLFSKINKNSKFNYKLRTIYNPDNNLGIGGIKVSITW